MGKRRARGGRKARHATQDNSVHLKFCMSLSSVKGWKGQEAQVRPQGRTDARPGDRVIPEDGKSTRGRGHGQKASGGIKRIRENWAGGKKRSPPKERGENSCELSKRGGTTAKKKYQMGIKKDTLAPESGPKQGRGKNR